MRRIHADIVVLFVVLLALTTLYAVPMVVAGNGVDAGIWSDVAVTQGAPEAREAALKVVREDWLSRSPVGGRHLWVVFVLAIATLVATRVWWRFPSDASPLLKMRPAIYPLAAAVVLLGLHLHAFGASLTALQRQGLWNPAAIGIAVGDFAVFASWALLPPLACAVVFAAARPPGPRDREA